jgi:hypothetical protein
MRRLVLELDEDDWDAIQEAIARRQAWRHADGGPLLPDGESNTAGAVLAEICRGWVEYQQAGG